jgi:hypothetical protein
MFVSFESVGELDLGENTEIKLKFGFSKVFALVIKNLQLKAAIF